MKTKSYIYILSVILILGEIISSPIVLSQTPQFRIPIVVVDSIFGSSNNFKKVRRDTVQFGFHSNASFCLDNFWMTDFQDHWFYTLGSVLDSQKAKEVGLPPWGPSFEARLVNARSCPPGTISLGLGVKFNIHQYTGPAQTDTFRIQFKVDDLDTVSKISFEWPSVLGEYCTSLRFKYSTLVNRDMLTTSKWSIPPESLSIFTYFNIILSGPKLPPGPPAPVQYVYPVQGDTGLGARVTLQWNAVPNAVYYRLQVANDSLFTSKIFDDTVLATSKKISGLNASSFYYWRVFVSNPYGISFFQNPPFNFKTRWTFKLDPPVMLSPTDGAVNVPLSTTLSWYARSSDIPVTYRLQISKNISFTPLVKDTTVSDTTLTVGPLQYCETYYWRVNAINSDAVGDFSTPWSFKEILTTPSSPTLLLPADAAIDIPITPTLSWAASDNCTPQTYRLIVAKDTNFTIKILNTTTSQTSQALGTLDQQTFYYWKVKAMNQADTGGAYSAYRTFKTVLLPPANPPQFVSPANGDTTQNTVVTLQWRTAVYADLYHLQIATDPNFLSLVFNDSTLTDTFKVTSPLTNCVVYYWRLKSRNTSGASSFSTARNFKIKPATPTQPTLVSPADNAVDIPLTPTLSWTGGDICSYNYRIELAKDAAFTQIVLNINITQTSVQIGSQLDQDTFYYWRVKSLNWIDSSQFTTIWKFKTSILPPAAPPQLVSPANGYSIQDSNGTLNWRKTPLTSSYHLQIATDQNFTSIIFRDSTLTDSFYVTSSLTPCVNYFWRVASKNRGGSSSFSQVWNFKIKPIAPSMPTLVSPADNATGMGLNPTLSWTAGDICSYSYRLEVGDSTFSTIVANVITTQTSQQIGQLQLNTEYHWHVKSLNPVDSSAFSPTRKFRTILNVPSTPILVSPVNGDTNQATTGKLVWRVTPYADTYRLQVASDQAFSSIVIDDSTLTDTSYTTSALVNCKTYYWHLLAKNGAGWSSYTTTWSFKVRTATPSTVNLVSPFDGQDSLSQNVRLIWNKADLCTQRYFYEVSRTSTFSDIIKSGQVADTTVLIEGLEGKQYYYWHVQAVNFLGSGTFSPTWQFHTTRSTPPAPVLISPSNGASDLPSTITLQWDSTMFANSYRVQLALDIGFTNLKVNDSTVVQQQGVLPSKTVSGLLNSTMYYWRANAKNELGTSLWSQVWNLTTLYPPSVPQLNKPYNGETEIAVTPMFDWSMAQRADVYRLQVAEDTVFSKIVFDDSTISILSWQITNQLKSYTKYFWRVRAKNIVGWGQYSPIYYFKTTHSGPGNWLIPLTITETGPAYGTIYFGVHPAATAGVDVALGEFTLPPVDPWYFDARFVSPLIGEGLFVDILPFRSYSQVDTFQFTFQPTPLLGNYPIKVSWPWQFIKSICDSMVIKDHLAVPTIRARMDRDSFIIVNNSSIRSLYIVNYGAFPIPLGVTPKSPELPRGYVLYQNYPNPFNPTTNITFSTDRSAKIYIKIYDVLGREIVTMTDAIFFAGQYAFQWNGKDESGITVPTGVYYVRMVAQSLADDGAEGKRFISTRKMIMVK